jgi:hypothetical protein
MAAENRIRHAQHALQEKPSFSLGFLRGSMIEAGDDYGPIVGGLSRKKSRRPGVVL